MASGTQGDVRQSPDGLWVHTPSGTRTIELPSTRSPRELVLADFETAVRTGRAPSHDGRWGLATLELTLACLQSARSGEAIELKHQVGLPEGDA